MPVEQAWRAPLRLFSPSGVGFYRLRLRRSGSHLESSVVDWYGLVQRGGSRSISWLACHNFADAPPQREMIDRSRS